VKRVRYWLEWFLLSLFSPLIPMLPLSLLRRFADFAGAVVYRLDSRSRAVAIANLEAAFGSELDVHRREHIAKRSIQIFARSFLELFWTRRLTPQNVEQFISFEDPRRFQEMLNDPLPVIGSHPISEISSGVARFLPFAVTQAVFSRSDSRMTALRSSFASFAKSRATPR
jgi:lauroyl/myristoyl acyltransferase